MQIKLCVFDAYGTLFDVAAAARAVASEPGNERLAGCWQDLAADWRQKQLEYSWLRAITGEHRDFWEVTKDGLDWTLARHGLAGEAGLRDRLLALYWTLEAYPEVFDVLRKLRHAGLQTAILSNGAPEMLDAAVASAGIGKLLDAVLSAESAGVFKPSDKVYDLVGAQFGHDRDEVLFVSSNGWDAAGAARYGFITAWVNRAGQPMDRLGHPPHEEMRDLSMLPELAVAI